MIKYIVESTYVKDGFVLNLPEDAEIIGVRPGEPGYYYVVYVRPFNEPTEKKYAHNR